ncbi:hypothetical protein [Chitinibacter tainanensis]|uniref:hypothetical protein n=1 Tax=Chitinibacter tainanensis TaxID=230667 RepID=UPI0003F6E0F6|nr:hypothetical protein [Chitinibacter tainanensis]
MTTDVKPTLPESVIVTMGIYGVMPTVRIVSIGQASKEQKAEAREETEYLMRHNELRWAFELYDDKIGKCWGINPIDAGLVVRLLEGVVEWTQDLKVRLLGAPSEPQTSEIFGVAVSVMEAAVQKAQEAGVAIPAHNQKKYVWEWWQIVALASGVSEDLAELGRATMREALQHDWSAGLKAKFGPEASADMLQLAHDNPELAKKTWREALERDGD